MALAGRHKGDWFIAERVNHRHSTFCCLLGIIADPEIAAVRLHCDPHRLLSGFDRPGHFKIVHADDSGPAGIRHGHIKSLLPLIKDPVGSRRLQADHGIKLRIAADAENRIDNRNRLIVVHDQDKKLIQINGRLKTESPLGVTLETFGTFRDTCSFRQRVNPDRRLKRRDGRTCGSVGNAKFHIGIIVLGNGHRFTRHSGDRVD